MTPTRIHVYPADEYGCGHYRLVWPARALQNVTQELDITIHMPGMGVGLTGVMFGDKLQKVNAPKDADVVVVQRPSSSILVQAIPLLQRQGITVVVDMDDDLNRIHPTNPAWAGLHPKRNPASNWHNVNKACRLADLVTVSTDALVPVYRGKQPTRVLHNYVPLEYVTGVPREDNDVIGWAGSLHSHPDDLREVRAAVARVKSIIKVVGPGDGVARELGLDGVAATGVVKFTDWPQAVGRIGVGIAPLADTKFNTAKSWLKPLEYAACGVPWIASDRVEYRRLHELGCGQLARSTREWASKLRWLVSEPNARQDLSDAGRAVAQTQSIQANCWKWAEVWLEAVNTSRKARNTA